MHYNIMESPVEDFDVLNVIPLFLGLTDISLVSPMFVFLLVLMILTVVYYYLLVNPRYQIIHKVF